jgi:hypothetical protein
MLEILHFVQDDKKTVLQEALLANVINTRKDKMLHSAPDDKLVWRRRGLASKEPGSRRALAPEAAFGGCFAFSFTGTLARGQTDGA